MKHIQELLFARGYKRADARFAVGPRDRNSLALLAPTGRPVTAKVFSDGAGRQIFANMQRLWRSSFGEGRQPPGLLEPVEYIPEHELVITELLPGRGFDDLGRWSDKVLDDVIRLLAALHESDAAPGESRSSRAVVRSISRKVEGITTRGSPLADSVRQVMAALERTRPDDCELVPSHGHLSPRNIWVAPGRTVLTNWDRLQRAAPARDVAHFGAGAWVTMLREGKTPDWAMLGRAVAVYQSARPVAVVEKQLRFHTAAALIRQACRLVESGGQYAPMAPQVVEEALRQLQ
ncbi:MAG TPA: phosphotransferase [Verrucomicrobiae bacterium]